MKRNIITFLLILCFNFNCQSIYLMISPDEKYTLYAGIIGDYKCIQEYNKQEEEDGSTIAKFIKLGCIIDFPLSFAVDTIAMIVYPFLLFETLDSE